jgi:hypothetical protein
MQNCLCLVSVSRGYSSLAFNVSSYRTLMRVKGSQQWRVMFVGYVLNSGPRSIQLSLPNEPVS